MRAQGRLPTRAVHERTSAEAPRGARRRAMDAGGARGWRGVETRKRATRRNLTSNSRI